MSLVQFIEDTTQIANSNGIRILLSDNTNVIYPYDGSYVSGYFDQVTKVLAVAKGREDWLDIHMDQFLENSQIWTDGVDSIDRYFDWVGGKEVNDHINHTIRAGLIEFDCEKRAVVKIKKYNLPINVEHYIKKANAYSQFYLHSLKTRKWYPVDNKPYDNLQILNACNTEFPDVYSLDAKLEEAFDLVYGNNKETL